MVPQVVVPKRFWETPLFWLFVAVTALAALIVLLRWGWSPSGQGDIDSLWQFSLEIFLGGFFTAALTYAGVLLQAEKSAQLAREQANLEAGQRKEERNSDMDRQNQHEDRLFQQALARDVKVALYAELLEYAIELAYRDDENSDDIRRIESLLFRLQVFAGPDVLAAAQEMVERMVKTSHGLGKQTIASFAEACHRDLYRYTETGSAPRSPRPLATFLEGIQRQVLGISRDLIYVHIGGKLEVWHAIRTSPQINFVIGQDGVVKSYVNTPKELDDASNRLRVEPDDVLVFWSGPNHAPGILGAARVLREPANGLRWLASVSKSNMLTFDNTEVGLPKPLEIVVPGSLVKPEHVQEIQTWVDRMKQHRKGALERLRGRDLPGTVNQYSFYFDVSVDALADAFAHSLADHGKVVLRFPRAGVETFIEPQAWTKERCNWLERHVSGTWQLGLCAGEEGYGRDAPLIKSARQARKVRGNLILGDGDGLSAPLVLEIDWEGQDAFESGEPGASAEAQGAVVAT